ncbi:MAG: formate/nitrite transporter family protein [Muribaculum sp.]|nr:formate/nitrite transporter family protein [Muribaculum sp.]
MSTNTPAEITRRAAAIGESKLNIQQSSYPRFAIMTVLAGAYIAFGGILSVILGFGFPELTAANPGLQRLLSGAAFPIGLILVVVLGAELFTGNNAVLMPTFMTRHCSIGQILANWCFVYLGNFAGALLFVYFFVYSTGLTTPDPWHSAIINIAEAKVSMTWWTVFLKGVGANWCVCLAIWLALSAKSSGAKMFGCWLPVAAFVALGYEHCIANMFFIPAGMLEGASVSVGQMITANLIPSTLGNIAGGALLVGCLHSYLYLSKEETAHDCRRNTRN